MSRPTTRILSLVFSLLFLCASAPATQDLSTLQRLQAPGRSWALEVLLPGFTITQNVPSVDGRGRSLRAVIEPEGYILTILISPASSRKVSSKDLRDQAAERLKSQPSARRDEFRTAEYRELALLEYVVREFKGQPIEQKHLNAYVSRDGIWIDLHFSKTLYRAGDEKLFYSVLDTVRFTDAPTRRP